MSTVWRSHYHCHFHCILTPTRFFKKNQNSSFDSVTVWCKASPNPKTCLLLIHPALAFQTQHSPHTCPYRSNGLRLQCSPPGICRHSPLPYWYSLTHFDYSGPYLQHTRQHLWDKTRRQDTWVMKPSGKSIKRNVYVMNLPQTMLSLVICASEANGRRALWSFLGMKFDGDVLKNLRQSTSYFQLET